MSMTGIERIAQILKHKPVDRIGLHEHFWADTIGNWTTQGHIKEGENVTDHFGFDLERCSPFDMIADYLAEPEIIEENEETILTRDGNGAVLRNHKLHSSTPEHVDYKVKEQKDWEEFIKPLLKADLGRINFEEYRRVKNHAKENDIFFVWAGMNVFEIMHRVCGHENMLVGMALEPEWIVDMVSTYTKLTIELQEILFEKEGYPDGIWYYEDLGFKQKPFMSPAMYDELIKPGHIKSIGYAKSKNLPVIVHSCGYIEPLLPSMIEAGIDCLQAIEVKAGMDLLKLYKEYGDVLSFMGGIDIRALYSNDKAIIDKELEDKIPIVKRNNGFVLHTDHSIPTTVNYDTYKYFIERGLELGKY